MADEADTTSRSTGTIIRLILAVAVIAVLAVFAVTNGQPAVSAAVGAVLGFIAARRLA